MNEEMLRAKVVKRRKEMNRLDGGYVPDRTWHYLKHKQYIEDALIQDDEEKAIQHIVREIDELYSAVPYGGSRLSTQTDEYSHHSSDEVQEESMPKVGEYVSGRAKAISESLAAFADGRPDVIEFREKCLSGRLLSAEEASAVVDESESILGDLRELELRKLGSILANDYYGWDEQGAIWYVLTGTAPRLRPITIRGRGKLPAADGVVPFQHSVALSVLPWVPAKELERAYRTVQEQLLEEKPRETGLRIMEVAQFCWEQHRRTGPMPSWRTYFERWNRTFPEKRFKKWRNFREYFLRGAKAAIPNYKLPELKASAGKKEMHTTQEHLLKTLEGHHGILGDRFIEATFE
jgi:hypothetical protein